MQKSTESILRSVSNQNISNARITSVQMQQQGYKRKTLTMQSFPPIEFAIFTKSKSKNQLLYSLRYTLKGKGLRNGKVEVGSHRYINVLAKPTTGTTCARHIDSIVLAVPSCRHVVERLDTKLFNLYIRVLSLSLENVPQQKPRTDYPIKRINRPHSTMQCSD
jgi:hypothetical protein